VLLFENNNVRYIHRNHSFQSIWTKSLKIQVKTTFTHCVTDTPTCLLFDRAVYFSERTDLHRDLLMALSKNKKA